LNAKVFNDINILLTIHYFEETSREWGLIAT